MQTEADKNYYLKKKYNISIEEYKRMLESQEYRCAICAKTLEENKKDLAVDHDHKTGQIRGLLCTACNQGIGLFKENINLLASVIDYLFKNDERFEWDEHTESPQMQKIDKEEI